jgi:NADPH:quinone reductase-like Zn-dependent oxidoreductase
MAPQTTNAIQIVRHGRPEVFVENEILLDAPGPTEAHVRVLASGVNFADLMMRAGLYGTVPPMPYSPGFEIAGEIVQVGSSVSDWKEGDKVVAIVRHGGYARDIVIPAKQLFHYPDSLSPEQAVAIPVVFLTAWVCLFYAGNARPSETTLILGAGGGVGTAAVQLAKRHGMRVIGTAGNERKREFVKNDLGAEACFDSRNEWESEVLSLVGTRGIDIALDPVGGRATVSCQRLLAPLGRLIFYGMSEAMPKRKRSWAKAAWAWLRTPRFHPLSLVQPNIGIFGVHLLHLQHKETILQPAMEQIYRAVADGELSPVLDRVFPLSRDGAIEAHRYLHARKNLGKVVLSIQDRQ